MFVFNGEFLRIYVYLLNTASRDVIFKFWRLKNVFTPRLVLARKHEMSVPCDTDLSATNQKAPFRLRTWSYEPEKNSGRF